MKKKVVIAGVVVAVIAVAAGISAMRKKPVEEEALIPVVNVENPQMGSIELYRSLVGKVEPSDVVYIYPKAAGEITDVFVKAGDMVQEGQPICKIDTKQVEAARLQMESAQQAKNAQIAYDSAKLNYDYQVEFANVTAPISGKVETCNIEVHDNVASQVLLAVISGAGSKSITFSVPEKVVTELHVGDPISVDKNGTDYQGTINEVSSMIDDSTGLFKVKASVENGDALPTGSTTKISVISDRADNVLTIPVDAVYYSGGDAYVYTYDNGTVHYVPVEVGLYDSQKAQILSGINASDEVITTWSSELYEGSQVQKADPNAAADTQEADASAETSADAQSADNAESTEASGEETSGN